VALLSVILLQRTIIQPTFQNCLQIILASCRNIDHASAAEGQSVFRSYSDNWDSTIRSCVLKDAFHVINMFRLPSTHGLRLEFGHQLRDSDAIFIPDAEDRLRINAWGASQSPPQTFEKIRASRPAWLWRRCRRIIPPPKILCPLVEQVFRIFGPLKDATTSDVKARLGPVLSRDPPDLSRSERF
jgi:hypothetical protein